jgi:hypothetical protein
VNNGGKHLTGLNCRDFRLLQELLMKLAIQQRIQRKSKLHEKYQHPQRLSQMARSTIASSAILRMGRNTAPVAVNDITRSWADVIIAELCG